MQFNWLDWFRLKSHRLFVDYAVCTNERSFIVFGNVNNRFDTCTQTYVMRIVNTTDFNMITNCHVTLWLVVSCRRRRCICAIHFAAQYQFKNCWYFNCDQLNWMFAACCVRYFSQSHKRWLADCFFLSLCWTDSSRKFVINHDCV